MLGDCTLQLKATDYQRDKKVRNDTLLEIYFEFKDTNTLKVKECKNIPEKQ